ncbi:unnamed protein product [Brassica oleracea]
MVLWSYGLMNPRRAKHRYHELRMDTKIFVFVKKVVKRGKFKTGQDEYVEKQILPKKTQDIPIGRIPVMVKSVLCNSTEKGECAFDQGGYFVIKGAEKKSWWTIPVHHCTGKTKFFLMETGLEYVPMLTTLLHSLKASSVFNKVNYLVRWKSSEIKITRRYDPVMAVENLHKLKQSKPSKYTFEHLLDQGILELIGIEEEEDYHRMGNQTASERAEELHSLRIGPVLPTGRVLYQSQKHCQQAIGFSSTNPNIRCDTLSQQLFYPQKPLFKTMASECLQKDVLFNVQNAIVAVNVHLGFNQEDSIVMNKASLERGMFRSEQIRSYKADVDSKDSEKSKKMDEVVQFGKTHRKIGRVDSLDDDGFPFVGANMHSGDIVIGRCTESGTDHSVKLKHTERAIVQKVVLSSNDDGKNYAAVSLRQVRSPCLGDKFSSMHGQKGVLGYIEEQENFAFTNQGIVPDIVINPHAFPSRQTPGQLWEAALSKGIACPMQKKKGKSDAYSKLIRHATPFSTPSVDDITDQLHRVGFSRWRNERVYNGRTGEMMRSLIFMGPNFYQRLIHMSEDKVKFRNTGPVHPLTRQPVADMKRFGEIKFGEMERDCLIAHGASANLHERLFTLSDSSQMHICKNCNSVANVIERGASSERRIRGPYCRLCESPDYVVMVNVPYGAKLLYQELFSICICLNFETNLC